MEGLSRLGVALSSLEPGVENDLPVALSGNRRTTPPRLLQPLLGRLAEFSVNLDRARALQERVTPGRIPTAQTALGEIGGRVDDRSSTGGDLIEDGIGFMVLVDWRHQRDT